MSSSTSPNDSNAQQTESRPQSLPRVIGFLLLCFLFSAGLASGGFWATYTVLLQRDRLLARQEAVAYTKRSSETVSRLRELPSIQRLDVLVSPTDATRVLVRGVVDDVGAMRHIRKTLKNDIQHERFEPIWELSVLNPPDSPLPREITIPSYGVVRANTVRTTWAAGAAGLLFTITLSLTAFFTFRKIFRGDQDESSGPPGV